MRFAYKIKIADLEINFKLLTCYCFDKYNSILLNPRQNKVIFWISNWTERFIGQHWQIRMSITWN